MIRRIVHIGVGAIYGGVVFLGGLHLFFPDDAVLERLRYEVSERSANAWAISAADLDLWHMTGFSFDDLKLLKTTRPPYKPSARRAIKKPIGEENFDGEDEAVPVADEPASTEDTIQAEEIFSASHAGVRLRLLPLLIGRISAKYDIALADGQVTGTYTRTPSTQKLSLELDDIDLAKMPLEGKTLDLDLKGKMLGSLDLDLNAKDPTKSTGEGSISFKNLTLLGGKISGLEIKQEGNFTKAEVRFEVSDGKAKIVQGEITGDILQAQLEGEVTLSKKFSRSRLRIPVSFTVTEDLDKLLALVPGSKDAKDEQGNWHYLLSGTIEHPRFKPDRIRRGGTATSRAARAPIEDEIERPAPGVLDRPGDGPRVGRPGDVGKMTPEERRKLREERMRERRERMRSRREAAADGEPADGKRPRVPPETDAELDDPRFEEQDFPRVDRFEPPMPPEDVDFRQVPPDEEELRQRKMQGEPEEYE